MLNFIGDGKEKKQNVFQRVDDDGFSTFRFQLLSNMLGEKKKKGKEPTTLNRGIM